MQATRTRLTIGFAVIAGALAGATGAFAISGPGSPVTGPGMMMGGAYGAFGAGAADATSKPTVAQLTRVRDRIDGWLASVGFKGFKVAEIMAFTNNDYVAIHDPSDKPAFELLTNLATSWVMEEPPSMMWNTRYGMMGDFGNRVGPMMGGWMMGGGRNGWYGAPIGKVGTAARAVQIANRWLAEAKTGEQVASDVLAEAAMTKYPGYYTFDTTRNGKTFGMLSVNASTGAVWYHGWHGSFLAEQDF
ncbi:MAG TPA: hypothetical protein VH721_00755 [Gaiellaceae bacterium]|jgi:hypothetical protein